MGSTGEDDRRVCAGCLGSRECWVCEGTGDSYGFLASQGCARCAGTGTCSVCPTVIVLPGQRVPVLDSVRSR